MVGACPHRLPALIGALLFVMTALAACATSAPANAVETIAASVLVEPSADRAQWYRDVEVPEGTDGYELLVAATDGQVEAEYFPEFRSHLVGSVLDVSPQGEEFWGVFLWNEQAGVWEPLVYGADWFSVKDGHVMAWALVEYSPDTLQLPVSVP